MVMILMWCNYYIPLHYIPFLTRHEIAKHPELSVPDTGPSDEMDSEGYYKC